MVNRNSLPGINDKASDAEMNETFQDLMEHGPIDLQQQSFKDDRVLEHDDKVVIPELMMKMSLEELEAEIKRMEKSIQQK